MDFPDVPVRLSGGTLGGGGGCLGSGLGAQASVTSFPTTLEPWQVLQLFVVGDFWTCSCHARGALSGGKMSISHGCGGLLRALGHENYLRGSFYNWKGKDLADQSYSRMSFWSDHNPP